MTILNLPPTAKVVQARECKVTGVEFASYTARSSFAPLAEVSVMIDELSQADLDALTLQIETAAGVGAVQMPYISNEDYLVQSFKVKPITYGVKGSIALTLVEQRKVSPPENQSYLLVPFSPIVGSTREESFRVTALQYGSGLQATKQKGKKKSDLVWQVTFWLTPDEAANLDSWLIGKRGIYPFAWSPSGQVEATDSWLCSKWSIEYLAANMRIFTVSFLKADRPLVPPSNSGSIRYLAFRHKINLDGFLYYNDFEFVPDQVYANPDLGFNKLTTDGRIAGTRPYVNVAFPFGGNTEYFKLLPDFSNYEYIGGYSLMNSFHFPAGDILTIEGSYLSGMNSVLPAVNPINPYTQRSTLLPGLNVGDGEGTVVFDLNVIKADYPNAAYMVIPFTAIDGNAGVPFTLPDNWSLLPSLHSNLPNLTSIQPGIIASGAISTLPALAIADLTIRQPNIYAAGGIAATFIYDILAETGYWYSPPVG
jgi:phage-related protein